MANETERPAVLANVSETQIDELERQYNEGDHSAWDTLAESYGWSSADAQAVWKWFGERPTAEQGWPTDKGSAG